MTTLVRHNGHFLAITRVVGNAPSVPLLAHYCTVSIGICDSTFESICANCDASCRTPLMMDELRHLFVLKVYDNDPVGFSVMF